MLYYTTDSFRPNFGRHDRYIHALPKAEKLGCAAALRLVLCSNTE